MQFKEDVSEKIVEIERELKSGETLWLTQAQMGKESNGINKGQNVDLVALKKYNMDRIILLNKCVEVFL